MDLFEFVDNADLKELAIAESSKSKEVAKAESEERRAARSLVAHLTRESEKDVEATLPSSEDHLSKLINRPLKESIEYLQERNADLLPIIKSNRMTGDITAGEAAQEYERNLKSLLAIKKELSAATAGQTSSNITVDISGIFKEAKDAAKEAIEQQGEIIDAN